MKKVILIFVFALFLGSKSFAQSASEVGLKFNEAAKEFNAKNYEAAAVLFEEVVKMGDTSADDVAATVKKAKDQAVASYLSNGMKLAQEKKFDAALPAFEKARDLAKLYESPKLANAVMMVSNVHMAQGIELFKADKFADAAALFEKSFEENDKNTKAGIYAAQSFMKAEVPDKAEEYYKKIIELGAAHDKYQPAATEAKQYFAQDFLELAQKSKEYDDIVATIEKVLAVDTLNSSALLLRVQYANNFKKYDDVIKYAEEAANAQSDEAVKSGVYFILGAVQQVKGNNTAAVTAYKKVTAGDNVNTAKQLVTDLSK